MGMNDRIKAEKENRGRAAATKRKLRDSSTAGQGAADWETADGSLVCKLVATVSRDGGAIRMGYTRDGGAYAVGIYGDGEPYTVYISPKEDIDDWLRTAIEDFSA